MDIDRMGVNGKVLGGWWLVSLLSVASLAAADLRLADAVEKGDKAAVCSLLAEQVDVNTPQPDGATALAWAAHRDDLETADLLIRAGADANTANNYGIIPLWLACTNRSAAMVKKLLVAGADPNAANDSGYTALHYAASRRNMLDLVKALLEHGADPNTRLARYRTRAGVSMIGVTPLLLAAEAGNIAAMRALDPKQKLRGNQHSSQRQTDARLEASLAAADPVEAAQRLDVPVRDGPAISAACQRGEILARAGLSVFPAACRIVIWMAHKDFAPAVCLPRPGCVVGPRNGDNAHFGDIIIPQI